MADISTTRRLGKKRRHFRVRKRVTGTPARPRLVVTRSSRHITAQVVDDTAGKTVASASTMEADVRTLEGDKTAKAKRVGELLAEVEAGAAGVTGVAGVASDANTLKGTVTYAGDGVAPPLTISSSTWGSSPTCRGSSPRSPRCCASWSASTSPLDSLTFPRTTSVLTIVNGRIVHESK